MLYSHQEDASLANPFGPVAVGWEKVETMEHAASNYRDGGATGFETFATYVTPELAYLVEVERFEAKIGGAEEMASGALRVTSVPSPGRRGLEDPSSARRSHYCTLSGGVGGSALNRRGVPFVSHSWVHGPGQETSGTLA